MNQPSPGESNWITCCHLSALAGYFVPLGHLLGPLIVWLLKKDVYPSVDRHGKEALNFQISISIYMLAATALIVVLIGIPLLIALATFNFIVILVAAVKSKNVQEFRYPLSLRLLK